MGMNNANGTWALNMVFGGVGCLHCYTPSTRFDAGFARFARFSLCSAKE